MSGPSSMRERILAAGAETGFHRVTRMNMAERNVVGILSASSRFSTAERRPAPPLGCERRLHSSNSAAGEPWDFAVVGLMAAVSIQTVARSLR